MHWCKTMIRSLSLIFVVNLAVSVALAQQVTVERLDGSEIEAIQIDGIVTRAMKEARVTGAGIAIFDGGKITYLKTYGVRDKEKNLPMTPDSVMTAASLTKPIFANLVMKLVEEGMLSLDKPVYQYFPKPLPEYTAYKDLAGDPWYQQITLRMLLSHTSGFPNWRRFTEDKKLRIYFKPGTRFAYSGEGIDLAQKVVETVTGKPLEVLLADRIFETLHMTRTSMVWEERFANDFANRYDEQERSLGPEKRRSADAAGGMQTTLRDYSRFMQSFLKGGVSSRKARDLMLSPQIEIFSKHEFPSLSAETTTTNHAIRLSYGLGWGLFWTPYGKAFFKEGHDDGWRHYVVCFDKPKSGILIMTNSSNGEDIYSSLLENLLKDTFTPYQWEGFKPLAGSR